MRCQLLVARGKSPLHTQAGLLACGTFTLQYSRLPNLSVAYGRIFSAHSDEFAQDLHLFPFSPGIWIFPAPDILKIP